MAWLALPRKEPNFITVPPSVLKQVPDKKSDVSLSRWGWATISQPIPAPGDWPLAICWLACQSNESNSSGLEGAQSTDSIQKLCTGEHTSQINIYWLSHQAEP